VHRDLKPSNILLADRDDQARLIDFGIAVSESAMALTSTGMVIGTPAYLSPEQVEGRRAAPPSDVYALGLVLVEALTGARPFPGTPTESMAARLRIDAPLPETLPAGWLAALGPMTRLDPDERPTADEAASRLGALDPEATGSDATTAPMGAVTSVFPAFAPPSPVSETTATPRGGAALAGAGPAPLVEPGRSGSRSRRRGLAAAIVAAVAFVAALGVVGIIAIGGDQGADPPVGPTDVETDASSVSTSAPTTTPTTAPTTVTTPPTTVPATTVPPPTTAPEPGEGGPAGDGPGDEGPGDDGPGAGREGRERGRGRDADD
jgi:hypothetical protein